jgi:endonuclease/exonuclease/phosphatase family metal-dependent hydrolase
MPGLNGPRELRMLHWNIHSWRDDADVPNQERVEGLIRETAADVVSLVEVNEPWLAPSPLAEMAGRLGYGWVFVPAVTFGGETPVRGYGNALLTRWLISAVQQWEVHTPPHGYQGTEPTEPRTAVCARIDPGGDRWWVCGTHLPASQEGDRSRALERFARLLTTLDGPWLACGDFNTPPSTWLDGGPGRRAWPDPPEPTYPARDPAIPIDYCLASPGLQVTARALRAGGSDHLPILVTARRA